MSRIVNILNKNRDAKTINTIISSTFSKNVNEGRSDESPLEECFEKKLIGNGNVYLSKQDPLKGRFAKVTCSVTSRPTFNTLSEAGLLPTNQNILWIPKRWKQCPASDRVSPLPATCSKTPTKLVPETSAKLESNIPQPRVIIVGAGVAGISAAYRLAQSGFTNFQLVEALDRPGGRIHSCWLGDVVAELGTLFIDQASVANPLFSLAVQENLLREPLPWRVKPPVDSTPFLVSDGRAVEPHLAVPAVSLFKRIKQQAFSLFSMDVGKGHGSLLDFIKNRLAEEMKAIPDDWRPDVSRVIWGLINEFKARFGARPCQMSSDMFGSTITLPGGSVRVPLGLVGILGPLIKAIPSKCISYCKPVQGITWHGGNPRATVRLAGGDVLTGDYVIVTIPLGVLKCSWDSMFTPCVPENKMNAIKRIGFGTVNRIILKYTKPFWLPGEGFYYLSWSEKELQNKDCWVKGISTIENLPGTTNMLIASIGDEEAVLTESCTDESLAEEFTKTLRKFSGDPSLPYPSGIIRSKWFSDPFFRGTTSYPSVGSSVQDLCELAAPMPALGAPIVLFAGEATAPGYSGTILGSHLSGLREADRILTLTRKYMGPPPLEASA